MHLSKEVLYVLLGTDVPRFGQEWLLCRRRKLMALFGERVDGVSPRVEAEGGGEEFGGRRHGAWWCGRRLQCWDGDDWLCGVRCSTRFCGWCGSSDKG